MKGDRRSSAVTMADVAARAGVSRALVSIVFRGVPGASAATRERVLRAADEMGFRPDERARLLGSSRSRTVGVVFGLHREFHAAVVENLYGVLDGTGYDLALGPWAPTRDESRAVQALLDYRCESLIMLGPTLPRDAIEELAARLPIVVVARALRLRSVDVVRTDDVAGARMAVEHLAQLGHEAIVHVDGGRAPGAAERRRGYRDAMRDLGLESQARIVRGGLTEEDGEACAARLCGAALPTAVVAFNDMCAAGLMSVARARGVLVPERLSVVGYDDSHIAGLSSVSLTTVAQDARTLAQTALDRVVARLEAGEGRASEIVVPPRLVVRRTTAAPPTRAVAD